MEVQNRKNCSEVVNNKCDTDTSTTIIAKKRPFDVAFLMLPDEKLKQKQQKLVIKNVSEEEEEEDEEEIDIEDSGYESKINLRPNMGKQQIFDDPTLIRHRNFEGLNKLSLSPEKSAFTKVNFTNKEPCVSPSLSLSPDVTYQNSLSPSPPIRAFNHQQAFPMTQPQIFKAMGAYPTQTFIQDPSLDLNFHKLRPATIYQHPYNYHHHHHHQQQQQQHNDLLKIASPHGGGDLKFAPGNNPAAAAAILTTLLPPSLAALSLPGQNVCAKCNITFRMTSDLVYHMRSHHKNDSNDVGKRRREEKLKCPVCAESFRERHHLTRHMTAHQDKDDEEKGRKKDGV
ncbi:hypothetical protein ABEB36_013306 [Hypothenemus hampei]|uniref:C2H2-type domain-containing protein n=1 Tax=Hypothenemus hampei TaxID=57062 RepID=A0ABD1E8B2_HYPHA